MARKTKGNRKDFSPQRDVVNFRPRIEFIEPEQIDEEVAAEEAPPTVDEVKSDIQNVIDEYAKIEALADVAQERLDDRAEGFEINLDPIVDSHIIDAMRRSFPDKDPTKISFDDYKKSLQCINLHSENKVQTVDPAEQFRALGDLNRINFGGLGKPNGLNRPDLDSASSPVDPINIPVFQAEQIAALFVKMAPKIAGLIKDLVPGI